MRMSPPLLRHRIYEGATKIFRQLPSALRLVALFESMAARCPHGDALSAAFEDSEAAHLWRNIIDESGVHAGTKDCDLLWDRIRLRIQYPDGEARTSTDNVSDRFSSSLRLHRDTWANNVQQQINWWTPLRGVTKDKTMALCPSLFRVPIPNDSAEWSINLLRESKKRNILFPQLPTVLSETLSDVDRQRIAEDWTPVVINPGDVLVFSGAHLHGSVPNATNIIRFSSEVRTVDVGDISTGFGAPNVDGESTDYNIQWFNPIIKL